jgi:rsbT co-antagonist protein RsbR
MTDRTSENFQFLLFWATLAAGGCFLVFLGVGLAINHPGTLYSAVVVGLYAALLLYVQRIAKAERMGLATLLVSINLVVAAIILALLQPLLWVNYALVPLLAAAVLLQFAPQMQLTPALIACGLATTLIAAIGDFYTPTAMRPPLSIQILRISSLSITVGFVLFLLVQFRMRLLATLDTVHQTNDELTARNEALAEQYEQLQQQMTLSSQLVDQVSALETPITTLADGVLFAPIVGQLTSDRSSKLQTRLLETVYKDRARWVLLDLQGVPQIDTRVATELSATFQSVRLLGARICLCGISATVASVLSQLGIVFDDVVTARSPQEAFLLISDERGDTVGSAANLTRSNGHTPM